MEGWIKGLAAVVAGGFVLFWHPGLENAQNSITSALNISGQSVHLFWLALVFGWAFAGASMGHSISATLLFYLTTKRGRSVRISPVARTLK